MRKNIHQRKWQQDRSAAELFPTQQKDDDDIFASRYANNDPLEPQDLQLPYYSYTDEADFLEGKVTTYVSFPWEDDEEE